MKTMEEKFEDVYDYSDPDLYIPNKEERKTKGIELAEEKISKQALLEALFNTQYWSQNYITNPFMYITEKDSDF